MKLPLNDLMRDLDFSTRHRTFIQDYLYKKDPTFDYKKLHVPIGRDSRTKQIVSLDFTKSKHSFLVGKTGAGKSVLVRSIFVDRYYRTKGVPIMLTDFKPEFHTSAFPAQEKFRGDYLDNEYAEGLNLIMFYPKCFEHLIHDYKKYMSHAIKMGINPVPIAITFQNLGINEFVTLANREFTQNQMQLLNSLFMQKQHGAIKTIDEFIDKLQTTKDFEMPTIRAIQTTFNLLVKLEVISDNYKYDLRLEIEQKKFIILCLTGWDDLRKVIEYPSAFVGIFVREILELKKRGFLKKTKIQIIVDEAPQFVPADKNLSSKIEIINCLFVGRMFGVSMTLCTQTLEKIDETVFGQIQYWFLAHNISIPAATKIFKFVGLQAFSSVYDYTQSIRRKMSRMKTYKDGSRDWFLIDAENKKYRYVKTLSPLSNHREEAQA